MAPKPKGEAMTEGHYSYLNHVFQHVRSLLPRSPGLGNRLLQIIEPMLCLLTLDLEPARELLESCYSNRKGGSTPRDPAAMLRCIVLMVMLGETSFNRWAGRLKGEPELAVLAGFAPGDAPGVGTFYDFCNRLEDGPHRTKCRCRARPSDRRAGARGRFRRNLKGDQRLRKKKDKEEQARRNETKTKIHVGKALETLDQAVSNDVHDRLNEILLRCAVIPSIRYGLLGSLEELVISGDTSPLESQAAPRGKPLCTCFQEGLGRCQCDRIYSDPTATWGWDHYRECFYFGFKFHVLQAKDGDTELPLHILTAPAHEPDVIMGVSAMTRLYKQLRARLPEARIGVAVFDKGYDATPFYRLIIRMGATPIIPLNQHNVTLVDPNNVPRDAGGTPLCPGGCPMRRHCLNRGAGRVTFNCPAKRPTHKNGKHVYTFRPDICPRNEPCDPGSSLGPFVTLSVEDDPRLNPPISRSTRSFSELYDMRTCAERFNSFCKVKGKVDRCPYRREHLFMINLMCQALHRHAQAWVRDRFGQNLRPAEPQVLLGVVELVAGEAERALANAA